MKKNRIFFVVLMLAVVLANVNLLIDKTDNSLSINLSQLEAQAQIITETVSDYLTGDTSEIRLREGYEMERVDNPAAGTVRVIIGTNGSSFTYTEPDKISCCVKTDLSGTYCPVDNVHKNCN